jgi:Nuclear condensing complex subunits, C-term domain
LEALLFLYFHPSTRHNLKCRQVLSFFIQAFASSHPDNQCQLAKVTLPLILSLLPILEKSTTLTSQSVMQQLLYWTDASFLYTDSMETASNLSQSDSASSDDTSKPSLHQEAHLIIAMAIYDKALSMPEHLKVFGHILSKLKLDASLDKAKLSMMLSKTGAILKLTSDKSTHNYFKKFAGLLLELESA